jgi:cytochrome c-type biogenesis protein
MNDLNVLIAFVAGIASFASPCCLPLVPAYVSYIVGTTPHDAPFARRVAIRQSIAFVAGFSIIFVSLWASVGLIGYIFRDYVTLMRQIGGAIVILLGLHVAGIVKLPVLNRTMRVPSSRLTESVSSGSTMTDLAPSYLRSALFGAVFAAAWTPCIGPILGGIIGLASLSASVGQGTVLLVAFAAGLGVPFILVAAGVSEVNRKLRWVRQHYDAVSLISGAVLIIVGFLMITNLFIKLSTFFPNIGL